MELYGAFIAEGNEIQSCSRTLKISNLEKYQNSKSIRIYFRVRLEQVTNLFCFHMTKKRILIRFNVHSMWMDLVLN